MYLETMERVLGSIDKTLRAPARPPGPASCRLPQQSAAARARRAGAAIGRQPVKLSLVGGVTAVGAAAGRASSATARFHRVHTRQALVVRLGQPVRVITEPGLNAKVPFIDSVIYIDKRILNIKSPAQEVIASSGDKSNSGVAQAGERLVVDAFARYRITDPLKFYQTVGPDGASSQLAILLNSALRRVLGAATLADAVRNKRAELMLEMRDELDRDAQPFGVHIVDVRIRRADLPEQDSQAVYQRMQTERQREAAEFRAQGSQKSQEIRAKADRDVTVLLAEAVSKAENPRSGRQRAQSLLRRSLRPGSGLFRLLPLDAGL